MYVTVCTIASSIHIPYLLQQAPRRLLNFSRLKCGAYSRAPLIWGRRLFKNWTWQRKNAENRLLELTNFFVANTALIRGRRLFGGEAYSSKYGKSRKNMTLVWDKTCNAYDHSHIWILTTCIIGMTENKKYIILRSNKRGITLRAFTHCKSCVGIRVSQTRFFFFSLHFHTWTDETNITLFLKFYI